MFLLYKFCRSICRLLFKLFYKVSVKGEITLSDDVGYLICSNHLHNLDSVFIGCCVERQISFMGKKELFEKSFFDWFYRKLGAFPIDREKGDMGALKTAIEILKSNHILSVFPEGTRSKTGELGEFKRGISLIATRANVPIIPMKIVGTYKLFSPMELRIGEPIYPTQENKRTLTNDLYEAIKKL